MKADNFNPEREYLQEALFKTIGGYFFWLIKGRRTSIKDELKKEVRNALMSIVLVVFFMGILFLIWLIT